MGIDIRKFVDVNVTHSKQHARKNIRDTVALITSEGETGKIKEVSSLQEWLTYVGSSTFTNTTIYVRTFFAHGGVKLRVYEGSSQSIATDIENEYIALAVVGLSLNDAQVLATTFDASLTGIKRKILLSRAVYSDVQTDPNVTGINSLAVKYSETVGAEMAIGAYLSRIKIEAVDSVHDYAFTTESIQKDVVNTVDDALFDTLQSYNFNFNLDLSGASRNIGGNMTSGKSLINEYMLIVLHQTVTEQLLALLVTKLKGNKALSSIRTVLSQELNTYVRNGYLATDKQWTHDDWVTVHNATEYTIIEKNTPISLGYYIQVLPWSALDAQMASDKQAPPVYIVIADSYSVRKLTLIGEVI